MCKQAVGSQSLKHCLQYKESGSLLSQRSDQNIQIMSSQILEKENSACYPKKCISSIQKMLVKYGVNSG